MLEKIKKNYFTVFLGIVLCFFVIIFSLLLGKKFNLFSFNGDSNTIVSKKIGYVCSMDENNVLLFDSLDNSPFILNKNEIEHDCEYGDKIEFTYKIQNVKNDFPFYEKIKVISLEECSPTNWPLTSSIEFDYNYYDILNSKSVIMENEHIVSGQEFIEEFNNAINDKKPYYLRVSNLGYGTSCYFIDVFYDGNKFNVVNDMTRNYDNTSQTVFLEYLTYSYLESYNFSGIDLTYLTNTKDIMKTIIENNNFIISNENGEQSINTNLDMFWLYYDATIYEDSKESNKEQINDFPLEGERIYPHLFVNYQHYFYKEIHVTSNSDKNGDVPVVQNTEKIVTDEIILQMDELEIEPRDININKDGKDYSLKGTDTLSLDLSSYVVLSEESDNIELNIEKGFDFSSCIVKCFNYSDLENYEAIPFEEFTIDSFPYSLQLPKIGWYIYEINLVGNNYSTRYVFFLNRES